MIQNLKYSDFFKCEQEAGLIPIITDANRRDPAVLALVKREIDRCMGGVFVDGVFFSGWLYWHLNHWWIRDDVEDEFENILRRKMHPSLRDNEWLVSIYLETCRVKKLGYLHIGVRQFGKSEILASYLAYNAILFEHTQNVLVGGNEDDLNLIKDKVDFGIKNLWGGIKIPKLTKDVKTNMIRLGVKTKANEDEVWSYIVIRNVSEGKKTEGPAGVTAKAFAMDEVGKYSFAQTFESSKPAFISKFGWRCVPLLFGTGGSFEKGNDAERFFYHPDANNLLSVTDPITGEVTAIFMSGEYRIDCKHPTNLGEYLINTKYISSEADITELSKIVMMASDKEEARTKILEERKIKANDPDQTEYLKLIMYYPLTPKECFLSTADNFYNSELARLKKEKLQRDVYKPMYVDLYEDGGKVLTKISNKLPISSYPTKDKESLDTPVCILEHPIPDAPFSLYVAGIDTYKFPGDPGYSTSLGSIYIFKRAYDVLTDTFQYMFVAWYVGRPSDKSVWNNQTRLLLKYYNAQGLVENDEYSFIDYMETMGDGQFLMDTPDFMREFIPTSTTLARPKGISREDKRIRKLLRTNFKQYMEQPFMSTYLPGLAGTEVSKVPGIEKINDAVLLEEIEKWNEDGNFDREVAASLAITASNYFDKQNYKITTQGDDPRFKMKRNSQGKVVIRHRGVFRTLNRSTLRKDAYNKIFKN